MLNDEQKDTIAQWALEGADLAEIHKRISDEFGIRMTYFEARLLVSELQVSLDKVDAEEEEEAPDDDVDEPALEPDDLLEPSPVNEGNVRVEVDQITTPPQAMVSGRVTFSDGKGGAWYLDQMGRLGINADEEGYRPTEDDVIAFQTQLQKTLQSQGF